MRIVGSWYQTGSAARRGAALVVEADFFQLLVDEKVQQQGELSSIRVSDRLGNTERKLTLADGSVFSTSDNASVDRAFRVQNSKAGFLHTIESNLAWVFVAVAMTLVVGFSFVRWGVPWVGHTVAHALPIEAGEVVGKNTLEFIDEHFFDPSTLDQTKQDSIREHFLSTLVPNNRIDPEINYQLHFRAWGEGDSKVANALALPSGDVIVTDRFIELAANQDEIDSVLLHEMGHIEYRHSLELMTQSTMVAVLLAVLSGDAGGFADFGVGLGSLLMTTGYTRHYENEADQFALDRMLHSDIDPNAFANILEKMVADMEPSECKEDLDCEDVGKASNDVKESVIQESLIDYLSTHPRTRDRIALAKRYSLCYQQGKLICDGAILVGN